MYNAKLRPKLQTGIWDYDLKLMTRLTTPTLLLVVCCAIAGAQAPAPRDWPVYGGDAGGARFSPLARITRDNVAKLVVAWRYHTGEPVFDLSRQPSLQVTPIVIDNVMYISTPLGKVMALEPATGREIWRYDARVNPKGGYGDFANRGVATWVDGTVKPGTPCRRRIYLVTVDARLVSLDAASGYPCVVFGVEGTIGKRCSSLGRMPRRFIMYFIGIGLMSKKIAALIS